MPIRLLPKLERGCVADQPQHVLPAAADAARTAALHRISGLVTNRRGMLQTGAGSATTVKSIGDIQTETLNRAGSSGLWDASSPCANDEILLIMPPNPKPDQIVAILNCNGSKVNADTY